MTTTTPYTYAIWGTEISQRIGYKAFFIELHCAWYMRAVAYHHVCTEVNASVSKLFNVAASLAKEYLFTLTYMSGVSAFCSSMKSYNEHITQLSIMCHHTIYFSLIA